jgi:hypothetical protein
MFNEGRRNVHDKEGFRRPSLINEDMKKRIDEHIRKNMCLTLDKIHERFPQISCLLIYEIAKKHLHCQKKTTLCNMSALSMARTLQVDKGCLNFMGFDGK